MATSRDGSRSRFMSVSPKRCSRGWTTLETFSHWPGAAHGARKYPAPSQPNITHWYISCRVNAAPGEW